MQPRRAPSALVGLVSLLVAPLLGCGGPGGLDYPLPPTQPPTLPTDTPPASSTEPPPISGGTLAVTPDGHIAVAADPDRDVIWVVDLVGTSLLHEVKLHAGDEPGRVVLDASGRAHVALRRGGALVSIDPLAGTLLARRPACPAPRGLAYDTSVDAIRLACADGRLFTFPAAGGDATSVVQVAPDLRDVIVQGSSLYVTTFRSAQILEVAADGTVAQTITLPQAMEAKTMVPAVAWRTVAIPGGGLAVLHQRGQEEAVSTQPGGYGAGGGPCPGVGIVESAITVVQPGTPPPVGASLGAVALAVDLAVSPNGTQIAVAAPGSQNVGASGLVVFDAPDLTADPTTGPTCAKPTLPVYAMGVMPTAVAFDGQGNLVAQVRQPAAVIAGGVTISLPGADMVSSGHFTFHTATFAGIACASCHPEAGDDGRVWQFVGLGPRRTQNIRGGVLARVPFHWSGDIPDMIALAQVVFVGRMGGEDLTLAEIDQLGSWMNAQPALAPPPQADADAVTRGQEIFEDPVVGCTRCHNGPQISDHELFDVGTGGKFKVPSLIAVGYRAPYLHDGCAATLAARFDPSCGGAQHGTTQQLSSSQIQDLVAYLESL